MAWRYVVLVPVFVFILTSCEVPLGRQWYNRPDDGLAGVDVREGTFAEETELFTESAASGGRKKYTLRTNDTKYISSNPVSVWKLTDTSTPYPEIVSADVSRQSGDGSAGYGIIFAARKKSGNTYFLTVMINTRKQYMIGKYSAGTMTVMQDWKPSPRLKGGYGVQNNIRVTESGGTIFLYFNGSFVESFKDTSAPALSTGAHGYIVTIPPTEAFPSTFVEATFIE